MQLYSEYMNKNIDFPENGSLSPHEVLENVICFQTKAQYDFVKFICDNEKVSVKCMIWDESGRRVVGFGEAGKSNLNNEISQKYPIKMAIKRAFDDAAVHFLLLPTKDYKLLVDWEERHSNQGLQASENGNPGQPPVQTGQTPLQAERPKAHEPADKKNQEPASYEKTIVTIGRQKSKNYTVEQLAEVDPESLEYVAYVYPKQVSVTSPERQNQIKACQRWLKEHGGGLSNQQAA